ncbi:sensor histidine kinase [Zavarzinia sp. CC-PAN008]|uniref:sensor histidine kinase n=1 Tax=Zavarzinia sp. CC-PAN008 TaxID=3243332 RepID=UPI003F74834D
MTRQRLETFLRAQLAPFGFGLLLLLVTCGLLVWLVQRYDSYTEAVFESRGIRLQIGTVLSLAQDAETGQRGFLLTGREEYLQPYARSVAQIGPALDQLAALTAKDAQRQEQVAQLRVLLEAKLSELDRTIDAYRAEGPARAMEMVGTDAGRQVMDSLRSVLDEMERRETQEIDTRTADVRGTGTTLILVTLGATLLIAASGIYALIRFRGYILDIEQARSALQNVNDNLESMVETRTADLKEANAEIQRFAYIVSHDLRAPLVNVMGFTAELEALRGRLEGLLPAGSAEVPEVMAEFDEALGFIRSSTVKMDRLIMAILTLSREGRRVFAPEQLALDSVIGGLADNLRHKAGEKGATISVAALPTLVSDRLGLEQVFGNLLDNALKYLDPARPGVITVAGTERGAWVEVSVTDNGRGIEAKDHERVFELFRRAGAQDQPGEGIGLAHVRALVRRMGGAIRLTSQPRQGSTFTVLLPKRWVPQETMGES